MTEPTGTTTPRRPGRVLAGLLLAGSILSSGCAFQLGQAQAQGQGQGQGQGAPPGGIITPAPMAQRMPSFADLAAQVKPAVVNISTTEKVKPDAGVVQGMPDLPEGGGSPLDEMMRRLFRGPMGQDGDHGSERTVHALGSGFIIDPKGWVVTNNHVVDEASQITVTLDDGRTFNATVRGRDPKTDVAVLKINAPEPLPAVQFGDSDQARVGDWVVAIGNPFGLGGTVTAGIVSARSRDINAGPYDDFLQIDAPINRGNSGGPLFDQSGRVIGVAAAIFSPSGGSVGIGFAVPAKIAADVSSQLIAHGRIERGWLGVEMQPMTPPLASAMKRDNADGALVANVEPGSPAEKAGLKSGDLITRFGGAPVKTPRDLARAVAKVQQGSKAQIEVWRDGSTRNMTATIAKAPEQKTAARQEQSKGEALSGASHAGVALAPLTPETRTQLHLPKHVVGAVIAGVRPGSPAEDSGLQAGDVIQRVDGKPVSSPEETVRILRAAERQKTKAVALQILRDGRNLFVPLELS